MRSQPACPSCDHIIPVNHDDPQLQALKERLSDLVQRKGGNLQDEEVQKLSRRIDRLVVKNLKNRRANQQPDEFCPECRAPLAHESGCTSCYACGWGMCW